MLHDLFIYINENWFCNIWYMKFSLKLYFQSRLNKMNTAFNEGYDIYVDKYSDKNSLCIYIYVLYII